MRMRRAIYEAASALLTRFKGKDKVKTLGLSIARRAGQRTARLDWLPKWRDAFQGTFEGLVISGKGSENGQEQANDTTD